MIRNLGLAIFILAGLLLFIVPIAYEHEHISTCLFSISKALGEVFLVSGAVHLWYTVTLKKQDKDDFIEELDKRFAVTSESISRLSIRNKIATYIDYLFLSIKRKKHEETIDSIFTNMKRIFYDDMHKHKVPPMLRGIFSDVVFEKIKSVDDYVAGIYGSGNINISGRNALKATEHCIDNAEREVFAVSFPALTFWNSGQGHSYLKENKNAKDRKPTLHLRRYFIIRNDETDKRVFNQDKKRFINTLLEQLSAGVEIYLLHIRDLTDLFGPMEILDISYYDGNLVSEWNKIEKISELPVETIISYKGDKRTKVKNFYDHITDRRFDYTQLTNKQEIEKRLNTIYEAYVK